MNKKTTAPAVQPAARGVSKKKANPPQPAAKQKVRHYYDYSLLCAMILICVIGILMVYSSSQYTAMMTRSNPNFYFERQAGAMGLGLLAALFISKFNYRLLRPLAGPAIAAAIVLLGVTLVAGMASHGAQRWIRIAGVSFQPTEPAKVALIVYLAAKISRLGFSINRREEIVKLIAIAAIPTGLIAWENLSSGIIVAGIAFVMLFVACRNWKWFVGLAGMGLAGILAAKPVAAAVITRMGLGRPESYHLRRVFGWALPERFPDDAYQTLQGLYAIGSGGITGQGLGESIQKFGKLPEAQNDMIFPIICEELGLIGAIAVVFLFLFIIYRLMQIALNAEDLFGSMLCVGVMAHLSIQVILNLAVVTAVIPNTGVTLPFISYGGTAVLFTMAEIGIALSVSNRIRLE